MRKPSLNETLQSKEETPSNTESHQKTPENCPRTFFMDVELWRQKMEQKAVSISGSLQGTKGRQLSYEAYLRVIWRFRICMECEALGDRINGKDREKVLLWIKKRKNQISNDEISRTQQQIRNNNIIAIQTLGAFLAEFAHPELIKLLSKSNNRLYFESSLQELQAALSKAIS